MMTAGTRRVTAYAKMTAVGSAAVRPGKTYPLSPLDHAMAAHAVRLVFYYRPSAALDRDRLKHSLSEALSYYPAVTGRLARAAEDGNWVVRCNDAGLRVVEARATGTVDEWLASAGPEEELELAYWEPMGEDTSIWSPFYIQMTEFEDKGYAIGLSCTHLHADPMCAVLLVKAWADSHRAACLSYQPFFHPPGLRGRPTPNTSTASAALLAAKSAAAAQPAAKMSSATFRFSDAAVRSVLAAAGPDAAPANALAALFWCSVARAKRDVHGGASALTMCVDIRRRLRAALPRGFYGNALHFSRVSADLGAGLAGVASAIKSHVEGTGEEEYWSAIDWVESRREEGGKHAGAFQMYGPELTCAVLDHVPAYSAAFEAEGGCRPAHVTCRVGVAEGEGLVLIWPGPDESGMGRTVVITLPADQTTGICRDEEILRHGPTLLLHERGA